MRGINLLTGMLLLLPVAVRAQDAVTTQPLIVSAVERQDDSPLVRAARAAITARAAVKSPVIDNRRVATAQATFTTTSGGAELPTSASNYPGGQPGQTSAGPPVAAPPPAREALEKKARALKLENERIQAEAEQPYAGDTSEDRIEQRSQQIREEIKQTQQQLNQKPAPEPPPTPPPDSR